MTVLKVGAVLLASIVVQLTVFVDVRVADVAPELLALVAVLSGFLAGPERGAGRTCCRVRTSFALGLRESGDMSSSGVILEGAERGGVGGGGEAIRADRWMRERFATIYEACLVHRHDLCCWR